MALSLISSRPVPLLSRCLSFRTPISECHRLGFDHDDSCYHLCEWASVYDRADVDFLVACSRSFTSSDQVGTYLAPEDESQAGNLDGR
jgi:hypothetical protein